MRCLGTREEDKLARVHWLLSIVKKPFLGGVGEGEEYDIIPPYLAGS